MKSIVCISGSPRKDGNSAALVNAFLSAVNPQLFNVRCYQLSELQYSGCRNLFHCKTVSEKCGQQDDLSEVLEAVRHADIVLLATPIYFTDVTGWMKSCLDRWFSFFNPDYATSDDKSRLPSGKTIVMIQTQGEGESQYKDILDKYNHSFEWLGFTKSHLVRATDVREIGDIEAHPQIIQQAKTLAVRLCS